MPPCLRSSRVEEMLYLLDPRRTLDASRVAKLAQNRQVSPTEGHVKHSNKTRLSQKRRYQRMQKIFLAHIGMLTSNTPSLVLKILTSRSFFFCVGDYAMPLLTFLLKGFITRLIIADWNRTSSTRTQTAWYRPSTIAFLFDNLRSPIF